MNPRFLVSVAGLALVVSVAAGCGGSVDSRPAKWSYIYPVIIQPNCATANCHSNLTQRGNTRLDTMARAYTQLRIYAASPLLSQLLRGESTTFQRMPPDVPLSDPDIALIEAWGSAGANWDGPGEPMAGTP
jgi:hypothetical protein